MKTSHILAAGASALALTAATTLFPADAIAGAHRQLIPLKPLGHFGSQEGPFVAGAKIKSGTWTDYKGSLPFASGPDTSLLLTDGTVLMHDVCTSNWFKLTPDKKGKYETGVWSSVAAMPSNYTPLYFGAAILPDGRLIANGGEYNANCSGAWTNLGALYDPVANSWTAVSPPSGWSSIGDAQTMILPTGSYMLADCCATAEAIAGISGTTVTWTSTGSGKGDENDEEGWTPLPGGNVLTVDANRDLGGGPNAYEIYNSSKGTWTTPGMTAQELVDPSSHELGPAVLRPDGNIVYFGATGHNDLYNTSTGTWSAGPDFPSIGGAQYDCEDAPAALLPDGNVLVQASPGTFLTPSHFFEFSLKKTKAKLTQVSDPAQAPNSSSYDGRFLELPTGQLLWSFDGGEVATYTAQGKPMAKWLPVIKSLPKTVSRGSTGNTVSGKNFSGFSLGASYGDDAQMASNYPLLRITNTSTGDVCFARTYNFSAMGVFITGTTHAAFDTPSGCETGASTAQVVVNGLASTPVNLTVD
ncbi:MAG TPA: hypothetical protein VGF97_13285 [Rhizomicrobium sp.]|jgi:hypothetical protein